MQINQKSITRNLNFEGLFHLKELVPKINLNKTESIYIEFKPKLKKQLFKAMLKTTKTVRNLSKQTNIKFTLLWDQLTRCPFSLSTLKKISKVLTSGGLSNYDLDKLKREYSILIEK